MSIEEIHKLFISCNAICTDTRSIKENAIYFALKGSNFNGNLFAEKALELGCSYSFIDEGDYNNSKIIKVNDVLETLQKLANYHRKYLNIPIIGITGSNGKTTTKELVARVLQKRYKTFATNGNLNNHIGVPLSLLSMNKEHEIGVIEMGANHQGEIEMLSNICEPNYGLITNIGKAHLEGFGGEEGVIKGKSELYKNIRKSNGLLFVNGDNDLLMRLSKGIDLCTYGTNSKCNISGTLIQESPTIISEFLHQGITTNLNSKLSGKYNFYNILAAVSIGEYFKVKTTDIIQAIESYESDNNRSQLVKTKYNSIFLDAYNANPSSMEAAIENFNSINSENKIVILGVMNELGEASEIEHQNLVNNVTNKKFNRVFLVGKNFEKINTNAAIIKFESLESISDYLQKNEIKDADILIKGSRSNQLEKLVQYL